MNEIILDCGHAATPDGIIAGYAATCDGKRICIACAENRERSAFAVSDHYFAYLSGDLQKVTTWMGAKLARVVSSSTRRMSGFAGRHTRVFFRAVAEDGSRWYGSGPGGGMYCRIHRAK